MLNRPGPRRHALAAVVLLAALVGCAKGSPTAGGSASPLGQPALKLAVLDAVGGHLEYCDPDLFPLAHGTPLRNAEDRLPQIKAQPDIYRAILTHLHITDDSTLTDTQLIAVNDAYKQMQAIRLRPTGDGFSFSVTIPAQPSDAGPPTAITGTVGPSGDVHIGSRLPGERPVCPICLAAGTLIATPEGPVAVQDVRPGMPLWTADLQDRRIEAVVRAVGHTPTPIGHHVVRLVLADGRTVVASPGHPTADGRTVGSLRPGQDFDGSKVVSADRIPYMGAATWDLLPSGPTGAYWADGVLLRSTLYGAGAVETGHTPAVSTA